MDQLLEMLEQEVDIQEYCRSMFEDPTEEFGKLEKNSEKIRYCYERLSSNYMIEDGKISKKDETLAIEARKEGNILFIKDKDFVLALEKYNKSICLSPLNSENIGICYANRSAIYFQSGLYQLCLDNIELALKHKYPEKLVPKLKERQIKSLDLLKMDKYEEFMKEKVPLKLSYPANKRIPFMIEGLEYAESKEFGRYIRTKRDLYPGDIVIIEKPYVKLVGVGSEYSKCSNCMQSSFLNLFPCQFCTKAMFCGSSCAEMAWNRYHKYECCAIETVFTKPAIRASLIALTLFTNCEKLKETIESVKKKPLTGFDIDYKNASEEEIFKAFYCLATNSSQRSTADVFKRSNLSAQSWYSLSTRTKIKEILKTPEDEDIFFDILLHFSQLNATNSHELSSMSRTPTEKIDDDGLYTSQKFGSATFLVLSLLNHSCAPNVCRINSNGQFAIMVMRNIKAGDQLFDNYAGYYMYHTKETRQKRLFPYFFECKCEACVNDYPTIPGLRQKGLKSFAQIYLGFMKNTDYNVQHATKYFQKSVKFLKEFGHHYPCFEVCGMQAVLSSCKHILFENTPLELQLRPNV